MASSITISDEFLGTVVEILFGISNALREGGRLWIVENLHTTAGAAINLDSIESRR
jgi:hypothetical protein